MRGQAERLTRLISELTAFSGITAGLEMPAVTTASPPSLPDLIRSIVGPEQPLQLEVSDEAASAPIDHGRLQLVLQQLLENARAFGTPGQPVRLSAEVAAGDPPHVVVRLTNEGDPVPAELRETIFEPFRQGEPPRTRRYGGLGLGLPVARRAAEGAGGTLVLEAPGNSRSNTFRLELPLRDDPLALEAKGLRQHAALLDAQATRAIEDIKLLRADIRREREGRQLAEAQQLRAVKDFRAAHRRALDMAERLDHAYLQTVTALARAVEARDGYTGGHVDRVARYSMQLAGKLGIEESALRQIQFGAVLHDVGKIGVPDEVLQSPSALLPEQWEIMRQHPSIGEEMLDGVAFLDEARHAVVGHHERWDGNGYPRGLAGEGIPLVARIVGVADAYDAMTSNRPYRSALAWEIALDQIKSGRGKQFDPDIADLFLADPPQPYFQTAATPAPV